MQEYEEFKASSEGFYGGFVDQRVEIANCAVDVMKRIRNKQPAQDFDTDDDDNCPKLDAIIATNMNKSKNWPNFQETADSFLIKFNPLYGYMQEEIVPRLKKEKKKMVVQERVANWTCQRCFNHNFSNRDICNKCYLSYIESNKLLNQQMEKTR